MAVDKFGRKLTGSGGGDGSKGPPGEGFKLTSDGNYDISNKLLTNVGIAFNNRDAVNLETLRSYVAPNLKLNRKRKYDAQEKGICNVASPTDSSDVVTLGYVKDNCFTCDGDVIDIKGRKLINVHQPNSDADVATKSYVDSFTLKLDSDTNFDFNAKSRQIRNLGEPFRTHDAVNLQYLRNNAMVSKYVEKFGSNVWNAKNMIISDVADPVQLNDAVNVHFFIRKIQEVVEFLYDCIANKNCSTTLTKPEFLKVHVIDKIINDK